MTSAPPTQPVTGRPAGPVSGPVSGQGTAATSVADPSGGTAGRLRGTIGWLRGAAGRLGGLCRDLSPTAGSPLAPLRGVPPWAAWTPHAVVVLLAVVLGCVAGGQAATAMPDRSRLFALALGAAQGLPLLLALVRPLAGFWASAAAGMLVSELVRAGGPGPVWTEPSLLAHLGVLTLVGLRTRPAVPAALWLLTLLGGTVLVQRMPGMNASPDLVEMTTLSAVVVVAAAALRGRGDALRRLADQERISHAERLRTSILQERARIARELHDVVAHHMSLIAVQAEAAPYRVADPPPELTRSFTTIRSSAVQAMTELRRVLGVLRGPDGTEPAGPDDPQPTLAGVADLVAAVRDAGLRATVTVTGDPLPLAAGLELSAFRIVQEALSNALRHAPDSDVHLTIGYTATAVTIDVVNSAPTIAPADAASTGPAGTGHGLLGMRERVAMLAGDLTAGPLPDGGFAVHAVLPATGEA